MLKHEYCKILETSGYELFTKAAAKKAFLHEMKEGPDANVIEFIESMEHDNGDDIWEKYCELKDEWTRASVYPSNVCGEPYAPCDFVKRWGVKL